MMYRLLWIFIWILCSGFNDEPACYKDLKTSFFRPELVAQAFSLYYIPQSQWVPIVNKLHERSGQVAAMIHEQAVRMQPNPLDYPFDAAAANHLLMTALRQIFTQAMNESNVTDPVVIKDMFDYIKKEQLGLLKGCLRLSDEELN